MNSCVSPWREPWEVAGRVPLLHMVFGKWVSVLPPAASQPGRKAQVGMPGGAGAAISESGPDRRC